MKSRVKLPSEDKSSKDKSTPNRLFKKITIKALPTNHNEAAATLISSYCDKDVNYKAFMGKPIPDRIVISSRSSVEVEARSSSLSLPVFKEYTRSVMQLYNRELHDIDSARGTLADLRKNRESFIAMYKD